ncbi:hypothetical protein LCGC14_0927250 [marine sediment metagenome]|uniref:MPN635 N-terminal domain-containing protein n=1 Tax=marine sediment metagenome TaxID=412755 RepID=A0A0F9RVP4_9ZZZZ
MEKFDLNIENILEDWEIYHGIRELISNALDEQILTNTNKIKIFLDEESQWHIRDYGRGIMINHFTQNENDEKLDNPNTIGKFGIGLKDALATFDRNKIRVILRSKYGDFTAKKYEKKGFPGIKTLHAEKNPPTKPKMIGTDSILENVSHEDIEEAKSLFLQFSNQKLIESTEYGKVYEKKSISNIYINGVKVAEEEDFLFSYNITSLTAKIDKALNRERTNVGRSAYRDRVKRILLSCKGEPIATALINDLQNFESGTLHDELKWIDVQEHAVRILNSQKEVIFLTPSELQNSPNVIDDAKSRGLEIVTLSDSLRAKLHNKYDIAGKKIRDLNQFVKEDIESFEFKFVEIGKLTSSEKKVFNLQEKVYKIIGGKPNSILEIRISETMRKDPSTFREAIGLWDETSGSIIIKRDQLGNIEKFGGTLLHEIAHSVSGVSDVNRDFENELTRLLGVLCRGALKMI